jgi:hypothetical protein
MKFDGATEPLSGYNQGIEHEHESTSRSRRSPPILPYALPASTSPLNLPAYQLDIRCCIVFLYWPGS